MGGISILMTLIIYVIDYTLLADWKVGIFMLIVFLGFVIYAGINYRNEVGGYLSYGSAYQHAFVTMAVAGLIGIIFSLILYTVIDTDLPAKLVDAALEKTEQMLTGFGLEEDKIDEQISKMRQDMPAQYTVVGQLKAYGIGLIIYAVISLITSFIVRKSEPIDTF